MCARVCARDVGHARVCVRKGGACQVERQKWVSFIVRTPKDSSGVNFPGRECPEKTFEWAVCGCEIFRGNVSRNMPEDIRVGCPDTHAKLHKSGSTYSGYDLCHSR